MIPGFRRDVRRLREVLWKIFHDALPAVLMRHMTFFQKGESMESSAPKKWDLPSGKLT